MELLLTQTTRLIQSTCVMTEERIELVSPSISNTSGNTSSTPTLGPTTPKDYFEQSTLTTRKRSNAMEVDSHESGSDQLEMKKSKKEGGLTDKVSTNHF